MSDSTQSPPLAATEGTQGSQETHAPERKPEGFVPDATESSGDPGDEARGSEEQRQETGADEAESSQEGDADGETTTSTLPENWRESPEAKEALSEAYRRAQGDLEAKHQRTLKEMRASHNEDVRRKVDAATASKVIVEVAKAGEAIVEALRESGDTHAAETKLGDLLGKNEQWAQIFDREIRSVAEAKGEEQGIFKAGQLIFHELSNGDLRSALRSEMEDIDLDLRAGDIDASKGLIRLFKKAVALEREDAEAEVEKLRAKREEEEGRARQREENGHKPPVKPSGGGSGKRLGMADIQKMSAQEIAEMDKSELADAMRR